MSKLNIFSVSWTGSVNIAKDDEVLELMAQESRFLKSFTIGFELIS